MLGLQTEKMLILTVIQGLRVEKANDNIYTRLRSSKMQILMIIISL